MATRTITVPKDKFINVGAGPLLISSATVGTVYCVASATQPAATDVGHPCGSEYDVWSLPFTSSQTIWCRAKDEPETIIVSDIDTATSTGAGGGTGSGTVTSVGLNLPAEFTVTNSPVRLSGTLTGAWKNVAAGSVFAGPTTGAAAAPTFRPISTADFSLTQTQRLLGRNAAGAGPAEEVSAPQLLD